MVILVATISVRSRRSGPEADLLRLYAERAARYSPCTHRSFASEARLLEFVAAEAARTRPVLLLADARGEQLSSEEIAAALRIVRDAGTQQLIVAIGPADGWSPAARARADCTIAFGRITLPHELAAVVAAEQVYRALTILAGHPYHSGH